MKKKTIGLILAGCLTLSLTACKETPEAIVIQKDADRLEEQARQEATGNSLRDISENTPEKYTWQETSEDGTVSICANAIIQVPDLDAMPSYTVEARTWGQEDADRFLSMFFPEEEIYDPSSVVWGKNHYLELILQEKEYLATGIDVSGRPLDDDYRKCKEENIASMQEKYENAPEKTFLAEQSSGLLQNYETQSGQYLSICDSVYNRTLGFSSGGDDSFSPAYLTYMDSEKMDACNGDAMHHGTEILPGEPLPKEAENISLSYEDAKALAVETFGALDENLMLESAFLVDDRFEKGVQYGSGRQGDVPREASHWAYRFYFVRQVDGVPIQTSQQRSGKSFDAYTLSWSDEIAEILIGSEGIISLEWYSPLKLDEKLSENSGLISFQESAKIFEAIVAAKYRGTTVNMFDDDVTPCEVTVNRVSLELIRVRSDAGREGLLVPAWVFYGTVIRRFDNDDFLGIPVTEIHGSSLPMAIGAVNAIDGTFMTTDNIV